MILNYRRAILSDHFHLESLSRYMMRHSTIFRQYFFSELVHISCRPRLYVQLCADQALHENGRKKVTRQKHVIRRQCLKYLDPLCVDLALDAFFFGGGGSCCCGCDTVLTDVPPFSYFLLLCPFVLFTYCCQYNEI